MNTIENEAQAKQITEHIFNTIAPSMSKNNKAANTDKTDTKNKRQLKIDSKTIKEPIKVIKLDKSNKDEVIVKQSEKNVFERVSRKRNHSNAEEVVGKDLKSVINHERHPKDKKIIKINKSTKVQHSESINHPPQGGFDKEGIKNLSTQEERKKRMMRFGTTVEEQEAKSFKKQKTTDHAAAHTEDINNHSAAKKKQVRCKHFPNCLNSDEDCPFVHPKESCKFFPACTNGEKCLFLHPEIDCKFGVTCSR